MIWGGRYVCECACVGVGWGGVNMIIIFVINSNSNTSCTHFSWFECCFFCPVACRVTQQYCAYIETV